MGGFESQCPSFLAPRPASRVLPECRGGDGTEPGVRVVPAGPGPRASMAARTLSGGSPRLGVWAAKLVGAVRERGGASR